MYGNSNTGHPASHGIPIMVPDAKTLDVRLNELRDIFKRMSITKRDRETNAYRGMDAIAPPSSQWHDHAQYVDQWYLGDAGRDAFVIALCSGRIPIWTDHQGQVIQLDPSILFAPNKWEQRPAEAGVYRPMNLRQDYGDDRRLACAEARLWIMDSDWPSIRDALVSERERASGSILPADFLTLFESETPPEPWDTPADAKGADVEQWSIYEAVAWIGSRDMALVDRQRTNYLAAGDPGTAGAKIWLRLEQSLKDRVANGMKGETADGAREQLRIACETGAVAATAIPASRGDRRAVPTSDFVAAELWPGKGGSLHRVVAGKGEAARWLDLRFRGDDVRAVVDAAPAAAEAGFKRDHAPIVDVATRKPVSSRDLRDWVRARNRERWSQDKIVKGAADAFPNHDVPGRPALREIDASVRQELDLPERTRGRGKKGE